jgi:predicted TIM-barrel fold metal-dependent hydrolase
MKIIDPHHHLWNLEENYYPWLCGDKMEKNLLGDYTSLRQNYLISDLLSDATGLDLVKSVHLQAEYDPIDPVGETAWLQCIADKPETKGMPNGIVGFCNFENKGTAALLEQHCQHRNFRGIRHLLNTHVDPAYNYADQDYLNHSVWTKNFGLLESFNLSYDLQIYYPQMESAAKLADRYPNIMIILNHTGMPHVRTKEGKKAWRRGMQTLAARDNVVTKISGLAMLDHTWTASSIRPYVNDAIDIFGVDRAMFASNFPVDGLFSSYEAIWTAFNKITKDFSVNERHKLFYANAERYYRI